MLVKHNSTGTLNGDITRRVITLENERKMVTESDNSLELPPDEVKAEEIVRTPSYEQLMVETPYIPVLMPSAPRSRNESNRSHDVQEFKNQDKN